jgi:tRNA-specific 2-thiouridylase
MTCTAVAISGGIDSLVSAYLLQAAGHEVLGLHFLTGFEAPALAADDTHPIHHIGRQLNIPVHLFDFAEPFRDTVVAYFTQSYRMGRTPNPCLFCNPLIKFDHLWSRAQHLGADFLATGHYARLSRSADGRYHLLRGVDPRKEQSYFLARLNPEQLARTRFPLGDKRKADVRRLAAEKGLRPLTTTESQDVCFIREKSYEQFLARHAGLPPRPGPIVNIDGHVVGQHRGLHLFTVGQRRGIDCPAAKPYYVVRLEPETNRLVVGFREHLRRRTCDVEAVNWIHRPTRFPAEACVQIRYRHRAAPAGLSLTENHTVRVHFHEPQNAIAPGQGAVFYDGAEVLGGGWIV